jgi:hypothetical protein
MKLRQVLVNPIESLIERVVRRRLRRGRGGRGGGLAIAAVTSRRGGGRSRGRMFEQRFEQGPQSVFIELRWGRRRCGGKGCWPHGRENYRGEQCRRRAQNGGLRRRRQAMTAVFAAARPAGSLVAGILTAALLCRSQALQSQADDQHRHPARMYRLVAGHDSPHVYGRARNRSTMIRRIVPLLIDD